MCPELQFLALTFVSPCVSLEGASRSCSCDTLVVDILVVGVVANDDDDVVVNLKFSLIFPFASLSLVRLVMLLPVVIRGFNCISDK